MIGVFEMSPADAPRQTGLGNAMLDSSVACSDNKRAFDSERPITAIHFLYSGVQIRGWAGPYLGTQLIDALIGCLIKNPL